MGSKEEDIPDKPTEATKFVEDMDDSELQSAMDMPAGLQNLGNTCYMNATVQCLKTVPEFREALYKFEESKFKQRLQPCSLDAFVGIGTNSSLSFRHFQT